MAKQKVARLMTSPAAQKAAEALRQAPADKTPTSLPGFYHIWYIGIRAEALAALEAEAARVTNAANDILAERRRQIEVKGWSAEHDDDHTRGQLATAAACYIVPHLARIRWPVKEGELGWPWNASWWKPKDRRRDLVRAGALIIAEIERLDRISFMPTVPFQSNEDLNRGQFKPQLPKTKSDRNPKP